MVFFPQPILEEDLKKKDTEPLKYSIKDAWDGFKQENLLAIGAQHLLDNSDLQPDNNYNPSQDPQLKGYKDFMHHFYFSKSAEETSAILKKLTKHQENKSTKI